MRTTGAMKRVLLAIFLVTAFTTSSVRSATDPPNTTDGTTPTVAPSTGTTASADTTTTTQPDTATMPSSTPTSMPDGTQTTSVPPTSTVATGSSTTVTSTAAAATNPASTDSTTSMTDTTTTTTATASTTSVDTGSPDTGSTGTGSTTTGSTGTGSTGTGSPGTVSTGTGSTGTVSTGTGSPTTVSTGTGSPTTVSTGTGSTGTGSTDTGSTTALPDSSTPNTAAPDTASPTVTESTTPSPTTPSASTPGGDVTTPTGAPTTSTPMTETSTTPAPTTPPNPNVTPEGEFVLKIPFSCTACSFDTVKNQISQAFEGIPGFLYIRKEREQRMKRDTTFSVDVVFESSGLKTLNETMRKIEVSKAMKALIANGASFNETVAEQLAAEFAELTSNLCNVTPTPCRAQDTCDAAKQECVPLCAPFGDCSGHGTCKVEIVGTVAAKAVCVCDSDNDKTYTGDKCQDSETSKTKVAAILGGVLGTFCAILLIIVIVMCCKQRRDNGSKYELGTGRRGYSNSAYSDDVNMKKMG